MDWDWDYMRKITIVFFCFPGESTFPGLRKFIAEKSHTRVLCFLHIAQHGLAASGCTSGGNANYLFFYLHTFILFGNTNRLFRFDFWCFSATFSNISAISWRPVLVVGEAGENHRPWASNW